MKKRTLATAAVGASIAAALYLTTTSLNQPSSMLTASEANQLAQARYADYRNGVTALTATIPVSGQPFRLSGRVDWHTHLGYATLTAPADEGSGSSELLQWSPNGLAVRGHWKGPLPTTLAADGWMTRPWQQDADLDTALQLILDLGATHPENANQLQHSTATILRQDTVTGVPVTVYAATPHTHYWIADDGTLRRFEALVDSSPDWTQVDLTPGSAPAVPRIPGM